MQTYGIELGAGRVAPESLCLRVVKVDGNEAGATRISVQQSLLRRAHETPPDVRAKHLLIQPPLWKTETHFNNHGIITVYQIIGN